MLSARAGMEGAVGPSERTLDLRYYIHVLRRRWWLILIALGMTVATSVLFTARQDPVYEAHGKLFVGQRSIPASEAQIAQTVTQTSLALVKSYASALTTWPIAQDTVEDLRLQESPNALLERVTASPVEETQIIEVSYRDGSPERAERISNALMASFIDELERFDPKEQSAAAVQVSVLEPALKPSSPASPQPVRNALLAVVLGSLLAFGVVLIAERLDSAVRGREDVEEASGLPVLGIVPHVNTAKGDVMFARGTAAGEAYRTLRSSVQHSSDDRRVKILAVTSPEAADGKTSTAFNLAAAYAEAGVEAFLVEADLRHPSLARAFRARTTPVGLSEYLSDGSDPDEIVHRTSIDHLHLIPAGHRSDDSAELLGMDKMKELLGDLSERSRIVVVDTPPVLAVSDPIALAEVVDAFLLVVRSGKTKREHLQESLRMLHGVGAPVIGVVINDLSREHGSVYGYGYGYGYGGYGSGGYGSRQGNGSSGSGSPADRGREHTTA